MSNLIEFLVRFKELEDSGGPITDEDDEVEA